MLRCGVLRLPWRLALAFVLCVLCVCVVFAMCLRLRLLLRWDALRLRCVVCCTHAYIHAIPGGILRRRRDDERTSVRCEVGRQHVGAHFNVQTFHFRTPVARGQGCVVTSVSECGGGSGGGVCGGGGEGLVRTVGCEGVRDV